MTPLYETIFIDWYRTLSHSFFWEHWFNPEQPSHPERQLFDRLQEGFRKGDLVAEWMRGHPTALQVCKLLAEQCEADPNHLLKHLIRSCRQAKLASPKIPALIAELKSRGTRVIVATDNMDVFVDWTVPALSLLETFDDIVSSSQLGVLKSDVDPAGGSLFFTRYYGQQPFDPTRALLIDDSVLIGGLIARQGLQFEAITPERDLATVLRNLLGNAGSRG